MKKLFSLILLIVLFICLSPDAESQSLVPGGLRQFTAAGTNFLVWVPWNYNITSGTTKYPYLLVLPGSGVSDSASCVNDGAATIPKLLRFGSWNGTTFVPNGNYPNGDTAKWIIVMIDVQQGFPPNIDGVVKYAFDNNWKVDTSYMRMTGWSQGGTNCVAYKSKWNLVTDTYVRKFKKSLLLAPGYPNIGDYLNYTGTKTRVYYGQNDNVTGSGPANSINNSINAVAGGSSIFEIIGDDHDVTDTVYRLTGTNANTNNFIWMISDTAGTVSPGGTGNSVLIPIGDSTTYDFSGATGLACDGTFKYFGSATDDGRVYREVADFVRDSLGNLGIKVYINFQQEYRLDSFTYKDNSVSRDTIWLFTYNKDNAPKDDTIDNTRSYTPDYAIITSGSGSGNIVKVIPGAPDTVQHLFAVFYRTKVAGCGGMCTIWPAVRAMHFYGTPTGRQDTTYNLATITTPWHPRDLGNLYGYNVTNVVDTSWWLANVTLPLKGAKLTVRTFGWQNEVYPENLRYPTNRYDCNPYHNPISLIMFDQFLGRNGHKILTTRRGSYGYYKTQLTAQGATEVNERWSVDSIGANPQKISSYYAAANLGYQEALLGGNNPTASYSNARFFNGDSSAGKNYLFAASWGNEPDGEFFPKRWVNPNEAAKIQVAFNDGDGKKMGANGLGVKNADSNIIVTTPGVVSWRLNNMILPMIKRIQLHNRSRAYGAKGVEIHLTNSLKTDSFYRSMTSGEQLGNHGMYPEFYKNDFRKLNEVYRRLIRETGDTSLKLFTSEWGCTKDLYTPRYPIYDGTFNQPGYVSQLGVPKFKDSTGTFFTIFESAGIFIVREAMAHAGTNTYSSIKYQIFDDRGYKENVPVFGVWYNGIDASNGSFNLRDTTATWPEHYMFIGTIARFQNWHCIDTLSNVDHGLVIMKFQHNTIADSLMYYVAYGDSVGHTTYTIQTLNSLTLTRWTPSFYSYTGVINNVIIQNNQATITADVIPRFYTFFTGGGSSGPSGPPGTIFILRKKKRVKNG